VLLTVAIAGCDSTPQLERGDVLFDNTQYVEAIAAWQESLAERPRDTKLLIRIATAQVRLRKFDEAEATMRRAVEVEPESAKVRHNLALVYLRSKDLDKALATFHEARDIQATYPETNYYIGLIHEMRGDEETAVKYYVQDVNSGPSRAWERLDRYKEKQRALGLTPEPPDRTSVLLFSGAFLALAVAAYGLRCYLDRRNKTYPSYPRA
jgi:Flp pilus assembly protein TadD